MTALGSLRTWLTVPWGFRRTLASAPFLLLVLLAGAVLPTLLAYGLATGGELKTIVLVVALLALLGTLAHPFWGLVLFVLLLYIRPEESFPALGRMHLSLAVSAGTLLGALRRIAGPGMPVVRSPLDGMILGLGCVVVLSSLGGENTLQAALDIGKLVLLVLLVLNLVRTPWECRVFTSVLLAATAYLATYSISLYLSGAGVATDTLRRSVATGIFGDPNDLATTLAAGLGLCLARIPPAETRGRWAYLLLAGFLGWAILLTGSRGGMVALLFLLGAASLGLSRRKVWAFLLAAAVMTGALALCPGRMRDFDNREASASGRLDLWYNGIEQLRSHPLTGIGYGQFGRANHGRTAHSAFVLCFAELGLPGYFFWIGGIYYAFRRRRPDESEKEALAAPAWDLLGVRLALAGYLVASIWLSQTYVPVLYLLISLAVVQQMAAADGIPVAGAEGERYRDWGMIALLCLGSILGIKLMVKLLL